MKIRFEWDRRKAAVNLARHGVPFEEALTVFADPLARIFDDEDHSIGEHREIIIGYSIRERLLVVCFTQGGDAVRIFSARRATKNERKDYEENVTK
ncbi:MAG: BrnT family toxin [Candidatus Methylomirabilia bacterium]